MKRIKNHIIKSKKSLYTLFLLPSCLFLIPAVATSCIDEETPTQQASADQVASSSTSLSMLVSGLKSKMISYCNYYSDVTSWYATQDWGYPCYMLIKETMLDGFPTTGSTWNYQTYYEQATRLTSYTAPVYFFYYNLADLSNKIMKSTEGATSETCLPTPTSSSAPAQAVSTTSRPAC